MERNEEKITHSAAMLSLSKTEIWFLLVNRQPSVQTLSESWLLMNLTWNNWNLFMITTTPKNAFWTPFGTVIYYTYNDLKGMCNNEYYTYLLTYHTYLASWLKNFNFRKNDQNGGQQLDLKTNLIYYARDKQPPKSLQFMLLVD